MKRSAKMLAKSGLHALVWREENLFVAKCVEIEIASQGVTEKQALSNLEEAIALFFDDIAVTVPNFSNLKMVTL